MNRYSLILILLATLVAGLPAQGLFETGNSASIGSLDSSVSGCIQTFTIVREGVLQRARVKIAAPNGGNLTYKILSTTASANPGGQPVLSAPLHNATINLASDSAFQWIELDLSSSQIMVTPGETLAIRVDTSLSCSFADSTANPYATGTQWLDTPFGLGVSTNRDFVFQIYLAGAAIDDQLGYIEDFEASAGGWTVTNGLWEHGAPAQSYISQAHSGLNCWMTDLDAFYPSNTTTTVVSPWFDCSQATEDCAVEAWISYKTGGFNDGWRLEMDLDDGLSWRNVGDSAWYDSQVNLTTSPGIGGVFWGGGADRLWHRVRNSLPGSAGQSRLRLRFYFQSDITAGQEGAAFDDIRIEVPKIVVDSSHPYYEDFEQPGDGWLAEATIHNTSGFGTLPIWERGVPAGVVLGSAHSGSGCWATDLDGLYPIRTEARLISPSCDFTSLSEDPILELALRHDFEFSQGADGLRVEVDLDDGNGFQTLGTIADWYDGTLSGNYTIPGIGWQGTSNGWRILRHQISGAAGLTNVRIQFQFTSNLAGITEGCLVDDIRIFVPTFKGTSTTAGDDLSMQVYLDGEREIGLNDASTVEPFEQIEVSTSSPAGNLVGGEYYLVAEIFSTGLSYSNVAPEVWISLGPGSVLLQGGVQAPFYVPSQLGPWGVSHFYYYGGGAAGYSCRLQSLIFLPTAANGVYASSDAFELQFN